ncbi:sorbitol dehydrogenase-like [Schistocerca americana]|uniref:sorbitol dehydrogenase-like n=1 Tax=Schistocerca americana TaxID=7009 RepID=UPI001F4FCF5C|nr:sorbitol dehydrogenase-like [Schistocerca americana]
MLRLLARCVRPTGWPFHLTSVACNSSCNSSCKPQQKCPDPCDNLAAVLCAPKDLRLEQRPIPEPKYDQVLLKMGPVGVCASDVHYYVDGRIGEFVVKEPMVLGHEAAGVVEKVGCTVTNLKCGDRVAIEPGVSCRLCSFCKEGRYNLCPDVAFCATPPVDGNLVRYYVHAADFCYKLPDHVSLEEGALLEPLSVGVHACRLAGVCPGCKVLVIGAGPVGLLTVAAAKAFGANKIGIADKNDFRLGVAKKICADITFKQCDDDDEAKFVQEVRCGMGGAPHVTIDCSGFESTIRRGILVTRYGGKYVLVGISTDCSCMPIVPVCHEVDVMGCLRYRNCYPIALSLVATGRVDPKPIITHCFKLEESVKAFETAVCGTGNPIKILIHANKIC